MIGLVTLDEVLRFVSRSVVHIAFDPDIRNNFLHNDPANPPSFRIPFNVVAAHKYFGHRFCLHSKKSHATISCLRKLPLPVLYQIHAHQIEEHCFLPGSGFLWVDEELTARLTQLSYSGAKYSHRGRFPFSCPHISRSCQQEECRNRISSVLSTLRGGRR